MRVKAHRNKIANAIKSFFNPHLLGRLNTRVVRMSHHIKTYSPDQMPRSSTLWCWNESFDKIEHP